MTKLTSRGRATVLCVWLASLSYCLPAAAQGLSEGIRSYDFESVGWAVLVSSVGGAGRTTLTLLSKDVVVISVLRETWKDLLIAALAGCVTSLIASAIQSLGVTIPVPVLVLALAASGWARLGFFVWAENTGKTLADRSTQWAADRIKPAAPPLDITPLVPPSEEEPRNDS